VSATGAAPDEHVFYHGTDVESAQSLRLGGLNREEAQALGGGDVFWGTSDLQAARLFAEANPRGGIPDIVKVRVPSRIVDQLVKRGLMEVEGGVYKCAAEAWQTLNEFAKFEELK
jgi:hypothetical protein